MVGEGVGFLVFLWILLSAAIVLLLKEPMKNLSIFIQNSFSSQCPLSSFPISFLHCLFLTPLSCTLCFLTFLTFFIPPLVLPPSFSASLLPSLSLAQYSKSLPIATKGKTTTQHSSLRRPEHGIPSEKTQKPGKRGKANSETRKKSEESKDISRGRDELVSQGNLVGSETNTETQSQVQPKCSRASSAFWRKKLGQEACFSQKEPRCRVMQRMEITVHMERKEKAVTCSREYMGH